MAEDDTWTTDPLALCLSGGGYRAAAFHLGTLHYFDRVGLLGNLGALSTISGGSLLGGMYLLSLADDEPFDRSVDLGSFEAHGNAGEGVDLREQSVHLRDVVFGGSRRNGRRTDRKR